MNKVPLRKYIKGLMQKRISELKEERSKKYQELCRDYAEEFYDNNDIFVNIVLNLECPEIDHKDGVFLKHGLGGIISAVDRFKKQYEDADAKDKSIRQLKIDLIADMVTYSSWNNDSKPYREFKAKESEVRDEFNKLLGNLKNLNGKEGTAYCIEQGIPVPNENKAKNELLAPIDIGIIKGK